MSCQRKLDEPTTEQYNFLNIFSDGLQQISEENERNIKALKAETKMKKKIIEQDEQQQQKRVRKRTNPKMLELLEIAVKANMYSMIGINDMG